MSRSAKSARLPSPHSSNTLSTHMRRPHHPSLQAIAIAVGVACGLLGAAVPAAAQTAPDAGQILQEQKRAPEPPRESPKLLLQTPTGEPVLPGGAQATVRSIQFSGNTKFDSKTLADLLADAVDRPLDMAGLRDLADRVSARYRQAGYLFARAYLPPQDLRDGVLRIEILEGRYGQIAARNDDPKTAAQAQVFLAGLQAGEVIEAAPLERATLILSDQPGVRITPVIQPGTAVGSGDLMVDVEREPALAGSVGLDNQGNRYSGRNRLQANLDWRGPLRLGDQLSLRTLVSDHKLWLGSLGYAAPLGGQGLRANIGYAHTHYELGDVFASAGANGYAKVSTAGLSYPLLRTNDANLKLSANYQYKQLRDDKVGTSDRKSSSSVPVTLDFDLRDSFGGGGVSFGSIGFTAGRLRLPDATAANSNATRGSFDKLNLDVLRLQSLTTSTSLYGRLSAQWANKNLDSSERISLGGAGGIRAYPSGEATGDQGYMLQLEVRHAIGALAPYVFVDTGHIRIDKSPAPAASPALDNERTIGGAGLGARYQDGAWDLDAALAWRTTGGAPQADPRARSPRFWLSLLRRF